MEKVNKDITSVKVTKAWIIFTLMLITYVTGINKIYTIGEMLAYFVVVYCLFKSMFLGFYLMLEGVKVSSKNRLFMERVLEALGYKTNTFTNKDVFKVLLYMYITVMLAVAFYNGYFDTPILKLF